MKRFISSSISIPALMLSLLTAADLHAQTLSVDKTAMTFSAQSGGAKVSQTLNVASSGGADGGNARSEHWLQILARLAPRKD